MYIYNPSSSVTPVTPISGTPTIASGATVDFRPASKKVRTVTITQATGGWAVNVSLYDGTTFYTPTAGLVATETFSLYGNPTIGLAVNNQSGSGVQIAYTGWDSQSS